MANASPRPCLRDDNSPDWASNHARLSTPVVPRIPTSEPTETAWMLTRDRGPHGVTVAKMRITRTAKQGATDLGVHPGRDWFTVLSGTAALQLADRTILVETGQAAEFSTMVPHAVSAHRGPVEIIAILDHDGERAHLHPSRVDVGS